MDGIRYAIEYLVNGFDSAQLTQLDIFWHEQQIFAESISCRRCAPIMAHRSECTSFLSKGVHMSVGAQMRIFREAIGLTRDEFADKFGIPKSTLVGYELGKRTPNEEGMASFVRAGINANWMFTGEGPMMLSDFVPLVSKPVLPAINIEALEAIISGTLKIAPNAPAHAQAAHCASVYKQCIEDGLITPDGIGSGNLDVAA